MLVQRAASSDQPGTPASADTIPTAPVEALTTLQVLIGRQRAAQEKRSTRSSGLASLRR